MKPDWLDEIMDGLFLHGRETPYMDGTTPLPKGQYTIAQARLAIREGFIKEIEGIEIDENFSPHYKDGFYKAKSEAIEKLKE